QGCGKGVDTLLDRGDGLVAQVQGGEEFASLDFGVESAGREAYADEIGAVGVKRGVADEFQFADKAAVDEDVAADEYVDLSILPFAVGDVDEAGEFVEKDVAVVTEVVRAGSVQLRLADTNV